MKTFDLHSRWARCAACCPSNPGSLSLFAQVITEGDKGDLFYIIKDGEALVLQNTAQGQRKVNHLFKADFFGERALLCDEPR